MAGKLRINELSKNLKKAYENHNNDEMIQILESLQEIKMTTSILKETGVGKTVNNIAKSNTGKGSKIYKLAKGLYDDWKQMVAEKKAKIAKKKNKNKNKNGHININNKNNNNHNKKDELNKNEKNEDEDIDIINKNEKKKLTQ